MNRPRLFHAGILAACFLWAAPALAGPGGKIASAMFATPWGRILLLVLTIVLLPFIVYSTVVEWRASRRARRELQLMRQQYGDPFDWITLQAHIKACFAAVHGAWSDENLDDATQWMTDWYLQNQQRQLDRWADKGLVNICEVKRLEGMKPLLFAHRNAGVPHENSSLVVSLSARMKDYLAQRSDGKVVEGSKRFQSVETIWTFVLRGGVWQLNSIEEGSMSLTYAKLYRDEPPLECEGRTAR